MDFNLTQEQRIIRETYRKFREKELTPEYVRWVDENCDYLPEDMLAKLADLGTMGVTIPQEYGGLGLGMTEFCIIAEELSIASPAVAMCALIGLSFGATPIMGIGTEEQKRRHLPQIAAGKEKWSLCMTEPDGGTDILGAIKTSSVKDRDCYVVNGTKMWISGAHKADYFTTLVITDKAVERKKGLSALIIDSKSEGITVRPIRKLGIHGCGVNEVHFEDVRVPAENLLGHENRGWYELLGTLNPERISTSLFSLGIAQAALNYALQYSRERKAFGKTIGSFQILQHYLADIAIEIENARNLVYKCAWLCDTGRKYDVEVSMAKIVACRASELAALHGMEILGGYGFAMEYDMQRYFRDYKQMKFSPISDEMARNYIAENGLGLPRSF
ncbi:MAG: acyl-CoA/acyl-ACP dehydrogenase [Syntrophobacteraceae bacterium]|nr:acyl-CoA/acyl-ACP dehydrogenase [Syntrophobacteraceae bacterium]